LMTPKPKGRRQSLTRLRRRRPARSRQSSPRSPERQRANGEMSPRQVPLRGAHCVDLPGVPAVLRGRIRTGAGGDGKLLDYAL
jgi:hypothetical protein